MIQPIISIITGLFFGYVLVQYLIIRDNTMYKGPDSNIIKKMSFVDSNGNIYKFEPIPCVGPICT